MIPWRDDFSPVYYARRVGSAYPGARAPCWVRLLTWFSPAFAQPWSHERLIDEHMRKALFEGIAQVVILGAGFDTRAWRIAGATRIFEVDHPNTSAAKQRCLQDAKSLAPVRYVKVEFNSDNLDKMLASAGYDPMRRTFFLWEGVTNYLTEAAVRHTFSFVGKAAPNSRIAFTYVHRDIVTNPERFD